MAYADLREFLERLKSEGQLSTIEVEVDPKYEVGAIARKVLDARGPALLFNKLKGHANPVAVNLLGTRERFGLALECATDHIHEEWMKRIQTPLSPRIVDAGPCKENILLRDEVDLYRFPIPIWNELDGGPYITFPCQISKDPDTGHRNAGMYRLQVHDQRTLGIQIHPHRHISVQRRKSKDKEGFPVAIALGLDPAVHIATITPFPLGVDEIAMAGALRGQPVELVKCETIPLEVPATAEIIIEGEIPQVTLLEEGLFGEFTGYYGPLERRPIVVIKAITYRNGAIHEATYEGRPPHENAVVNGISMETEILRSVSIPGIKKIYVTEGGCGAFNAVVSVERISNGYAKMLALAILGTWAGRFIKTLILVDTDIDPYDWNQVEWAMATRMQPDRDVEVINNVAGVAIDPSLDRESRRGGRFLVSKLVIDATAFDIEEFEPVCRPHPDVMKKVEEEWNKYGIKC